MHDRAYTSPGGRLDRHWQVQIEELIGAVVSLEQPPTQAVSSIRVRRRGGASSRGSRRKAGRGLKV